MDLVVRKNNNNEWGLVESFTPYFYGGRGSVTVTGCVTPEGKLSKPYALRSGEFVGLDTIEEELGITRYLKAKKPIYSKLSDGFIVKIKAVFDYETGEYIPEKSVSSAYSIVRREVTAPNTCKLVAEPVVSITPELQELLEKLSKGIVSCKGERVDYLKGRL